MNHLVRLAAAIIREKERIELLLDLVEWIDRLDNALQFSKLLS